MSFRSDFIQICAMSSWEKLPRANAGSVAEDDVACCLALLVLWKPNCISEGDYYLLVGTNARASHGCRAPTSFKYRLSKQVWVIFSDANHENHETQFRQTFVKNALSTIIQNLLGHPPLNDASVWNTKIPRIKWVQHHDSMRDFHCWKIFPVSLFNVRVSHEFISSNSGRSYKSWPHEKSGTW